MARADGADRADGERGLRRFAGEAAGGRVVRFDRAPVGSSRLTFLVDVECDDGSRRELVLRHDSGDGPLSGTEIDLAHEAVVYRALADRPVRIPRLLAESADGLSLLIERAAGTENLAELSPAELEEIERDFGRALAELHAVEPAGLSLGDMARPRTAEDHARLELARWTRFQQDKVPRPSELMRFAAGWLDRNAPEQVERTALCHGDAGHGNFLHDGRRVTALLDWEFAHLGDPHDDLAWVRVRSHLAGREWSTALTAWSGETGIPLDGDRIAFYRALVMLRMAISCEIALAHASAAGDAGPMDTTVHALLLPLLGVLMPRALREAGCLNTGLDAFEEEARRRQETDPTLRAMVGRLPPWKDPR